MEEQPKMEIFGKEMLRSDMDTYVNNSVVLIGKEMETVFKSIVKANRGEKAAIYLITEEKKLTTDKVGLRYETYDGEDDFVTMTDIDGKSMDTTKNGERITYPIVMRIKLTNVDSDRKFRHAAEIISSAIDNSLMTVISSNVSDDFSRKIHSTLVYKRKRFNNSVASVVFTSSPDEANDFMGKVTRNNIKESADIFREIKPENLVKKGPFHSKSSSIDAEKLVSEINQINKNFK